MHNADKGEVASTSEELVDVGQCHAAVLALDAFETWSDEMCVNGAPDMSISINFSKMIISVFY
eukprot:6455407-Amphidinium_carterae.1